MNKEKDDDAFHKEAEAHKEAELRKGSAARFHVTLSNPPLTPGGPTKVVGSH